jgi:hypothetical protein
VAVAPDLARPVAILLKIADRTYGSELSAIALSNMAKAMRLALLTRINVM